MNKQVFEFEHVCSPNDREKNMVTLERDENGKAIVFCDPCIVPLVKALNDANVRTVASCCGHSIRPGNIALQDGRELIIAKDFVEARYIESRSGLYG